MRIPQSLKNFLSLILLGCCWGPSFLLIKLAVFEIPPFTLVMSRVAVAASILWVLLRWQGFRLFDYREHWPKFLVMGFFSTAFPFFMISFGETMITSSVAAIVNSTTPIFTAILAHRFVVGEKLTLQRVVGVLLGFVGILFVFVPNLNNSVVDEWGALFVLAAAVSYAIAMVFARRNLASVPSQVCATGQLVCATLMLTPLSMAIDQPWLLDMPSVTAISGVLGLAVLGTAIAFSVYFYLVKAAGPSYLSTSTLLFPVIGVFLGVLVLGEEISWNAYVGCALILSGLAIANGLLRNALKHLYRVDVDHKLAS